MIVPSDATMNTPATPEIRSDLPSSERIELPPTPPTRCLAAPMSAMIRQATPTAAMTTPIRTWACVPSEPNGPQVGDTPPITPPMPPPGAGEGGGAATSTCPYILCLLERRPVAPGGADPRPRRSRGEQ